MIYKLNNDGIVKLQNAGSVPEYGNIEQIAKYNREHGTNFYKMSQVLEHDKQQAQQKSQNKKKSFWEILAGHPESSGEAILNKTIETANNAELPETRSKIYNDTGKAQLATTAGSLLALPMLGEFSTYGLLGGASRLAGGFGGSAVGSYTLGKAGELGDRTFGTTWMKPAGQVIGGFAGWVPGSNIAYKSALDLASKAPSIARIGATDRFIGDVAGRALGKSVSSGFQLDNLVNRVVGDNGKIRLRLSSHTTDKPRELVLEPQGNNKFYVHIRTWDGDKVPANLTSQDKNLLFDSLYKELPEGAEILFPQSGPGNYATRGTVAGLQRLARDSRFAPTNKGVLQYIDKDGSIKTFEGTGFTKKISDTAKSKMRTKIGDVEINDPNLAYRQGDGIITDLLNSGVVKTPEGTYAHNVVTLPSGKQLDLAKSFGQPMFAQGRLWYGLPENGKLTDLIVTAEPLAVGTKGGNRVNTTLNGTFDLRNPSIGKGGRRVPLFDGQLTTENTSIYRYDPSYGYRKVVPFVSTVHFDPRVKPLSRPISEAERLGIPKNMRSNLKALEDQYYWGYKQWNQRYNAAVESGNMKEAQKLRDLHFSIKAPNTKIIDETGMPKEVYHGSQQKFTIFDSSKTRPDYDYGTSTNMFSDNKNVALGYANKDPDKLHSVYLNLQNILEKDFKGNSWNGSVNNTGKFQIVPEYDTIYSSKQEAETALQKILDRYHPNDPVKQEEQRHYMYVKELMDLPHPERSTNAFSDEIAKNSVLDGGIVRNVTDYYNLPIFDENPELYKELTSPHTDYFVKDPRNIKSSAIITRDDFRRIIPIVKRDNFHNPDIRYKQGGILKAQDGTFEDFWNTLPQNQQDSTDFNVRRYWELNGKPGNFKEAIKRGMYKKEKDGYHANSIAFNEETGEYEFMKSPNHPTIKYELDWFNSNDAKKFRDKYQLDSTSIPWKYVPKEKQGGILKAQRGTGLAGLPNVKIPENIKQKLSDWLKYKTIKYDANEPIAYIGTDGLPSGFKSDTPGEIKVPRQRIKAFQRMRPPVLGQHATIGKNGGQIT